MLAVLAVEHGGAQLDGIAARTGALTQPLGMLLELGGELVVEATVGGGGGVHSDEPRLRARWHRQVELRG